MKATSKSLMPSLIRLFYIKLGMVSNLFMVLSFCTLLLFVILALGGNLQSKVITISPISSLKGLAASISKEFYMDMLAMEVPQLKKLNADPSASQHKVLTYAFQKNQSSQAPHPLPSPNVSTPELSLAPSSLNAPPKSAGRNIAFVYQTHSNESYLPELEGVTEPEEAYSDKINVISVGQRLSSNLKKDGIGAIHSDTIYPHVVKFFKYPLSYSYSFKTLQAAAQANPDLQYYFDIHRDSGNRSQTTVTIQKQDYAQIFFIIGGSNPSWKKNEEFANQIHQILEAKHPGISKGIRAKAGNNGDNGLYNQNFSPNSILIEVGGPYNTLEECYRTTDLLADAISEVILNAKKVDARTK